MAFLGIIMGLAALSESMEKAKLGNKKTWQDASRDLRRWVLFLSDLRFRFIYCPFSFCIRP